MPRVRTNMLCEPTPHSIPAMNSISLILRTREEFPKAAEYLHAILKLDNTNGEAWGSLGMSNRHIPLVSLEGIYLTDMSLGHCYLMMDDLQQAYSAYQSVPRQPS